MKNSIEIIRHSTAHVMAAAIAELFPETKFGVGPVVEHGFYYDIDTHEPLTTQSLLKIEKRMREIQKRNELFTREEMGIDNAIALFTELGQNYKVELLNDIKSKGTTSVRPEEARDVDVEKPDKISIYKTGKFIDLCRGPHVASTRELGVFKLKSIAGAYWRGSEKNKQLQRIYGFAFATQEELDAHVRMMEEAEKRDHKRLGKELELFVFSPLVGSGLPLFLPKGESIWHLLEQFMRDEKEKRGYKFVFIPHIAKAELYAKSGHLGKYDAMMPLMTDAEGNQFAMKAMNCPHHFEIYNATPHSYRDLPFRIAGTTTVYRNEKSGELSGLVRVKALTQDDTHHVVRYDQIQPEIEMVLELMDKVYKTFNFTEYKVQISVRDPKNPGKYFGDDELWTKSEKILINAVKAWGRPYVVEEGEAAFYGPKIDIMVKDSIGRLWQLTTVQLDFNQPENFNMVYAGEDGKEHRPAVLHVAVLGSIERFMGVLIEHFAGAFPLWLAPVQVQLVPVGSSHIKICKKLAKQITEAGLRVSVDDANETVGYKIRKAEKMKVPYMLVIGDKEKSLRNLNVRVRGKAKEVKMTTKKFIDRATALNSKRANSL